MHCFKLFIYGLLCYAILGITHTPYAQELDSDAIMDEEITEEEKTIDPRLAAIRAYQTSQQTDSKSILNEQEKPVQNDLLIEENLQSIASEEESNLESSNLDIQAAFTSSQSPEQNIEERENEEDTDQGQLLMFLDKINSTITQNPISSFCFATVKLQNQLKRPLNSFQAELTFNGIPVEFSVKKVAPGSTASQELTLAGPACMFLTRTPHISIKRCMIGGMSDKQCQDHFMFQAYVQ